MSSSVIRASSSTSSLRSVPSYTSLSELSSAPPQYTQVASTCTSSISSPLGAAHYANPESTSAAVKLVAKLFPGSYLARLLSGAEQKAKIVEERMMTDEERKAHATEVAEMLERDRILGANLKMLGM